MSDFLETIAQQIDKVDENPLEAAMVLGGGLAFWSWLGLWGLIGFCIAMPLFLMLPDFIYYVRRRRTVVVYGETRLTMDGFHPFKARSLARAAETIRKELGEEALVEAIDAILEVRGYERVKEDD